MSRPLSWSEVATRLRKRAAEAPPARLNSGQRAELEAIAARLPRNGVLIADEVGMGKTRVAVEIVRAVELCGGRSAILIPAGLGYQWQDELRQGELVAPPVLRSLWGYLEAWRSLDDALQSWHRLPTLLLSHRFTNWSLQKNGEAWRWALLPAIAARLLKQQSSRTPNYGSSEDLSDPWVKECANEVATLLRGETDEALTSLRAALLNQDLRDHKTLLSGASYRIGGVWREWLEKTVGAGLGTFDLVVIDEAHKNRGDESGLTRLLANTVLQRAGARRVALTATPVELDESQWLGTLSRAGLLPVDEAKVSLAVKEYAECARRVRQVWRTDAEARNRYARASRDFERALSPYLVRRDKREDDAVQQFAKHSNSKAVDSYRRECEIPVEIDALTPAWRKAVLATEALSLACAGLDENRLKRLRLTMANGHGIAAVIDDDESEHSPIEESYCTEDVSLRKRIERVAWWKGVLHASLRGEASSLFQHPGILTACQAIEQEVRCGNKVLVFGRYTAPMRALVGLINAREMVRRVREGRLWPQAKVHGLPGDPPEKSDWPAVQAAATQLGINDDFLGELDTKLESQYKDLENRRERFRTAIPEALDRVLANSASKCVWDRLRNAPDFATGDHSSLLSLLARSVGELTGAFEADEGWPADSELADAFAEIAAAVSDQDAESDDESSVQANMALSARFRSSLTEEFNASQGTMSRLMYGSTSLASRRMMQAAFNRRSSLLRVLVVQSSVGREGLNLHKACRIVVNLHPEWNPAVAEQQIGRVDRVGSLWASDCSRAIAENLAPEDMPRIEIRPVIFRGTYDEHNWSVLRERWDDLRAQLHGIVVPTRHAGDSVHDLEILDSLSSSAPDFSPSRKPRP